MKSDPAKLPHALIPACGFPNLCDKSCFLRLRLTLASQTKNRRLGGTRAARTQAQQRRLSFFPDRSGEGQAMHPSKIGAGNLRCSHYEGPISVMEITTRCDSGCACTKLGAPSSARLILRNAAAEEAL